MGSRRRHHPADRGRGRRDAVDNLPLLGRAAVELLADVAVERLRLDMLPIDTGSARGDLEVWTEQYCEEMSSGIGRDMMRDVLAVQDNANACAMPSPANRSR